MSHLILYRIGAGLLVLGSLGHTLGGMLRTARRGPEAGAQADEVFAAMKSVHFTWRGADSTWFAFWLGNGLSVSSLLLLAIVVLWSLGGLDPSQQKATLPIAWAAFISLALLAVLGFKYFGTRVGIAFAVIAVLTCIAVVMSTVASAGPPLEGR